MGGDRLGWPPSRCSPGGDQTSARAAPRLDVWCGLHNVPQFELHTSLGAGQVVSVYFESCFLSMRGTESAHVCSANNQRATVATLGLQPWTMTSTIQFCSTEGNGRRRQLSSHHPETPTALCSYLQLLIAELPTD
ncbi:hypothetical protein RRG08_033475 [Elysia crispata]|uniref:Uncharacterized protein n=1 Tax=Elysia crispata TaxID=231223 RepID=A0AAE1ATU5_9GAST|nr:hypothetical protein RRG08_033475 [Elysia crispata]